MENCKQQRVIAIILYLPRTLSHSLALSLIHNLQHAVDDVSCSFAQFSFLGLVRTVNNK